MNSDLYHAVIDDNIDVFRVIDARLSIPAQVTPTNNTVLHLACQYKSIKCVEEILRVHDVQLLLQINSRDETALHLAARSGHGGVVKALIEKAKSCHQQPNYLQHTTLSLVQVLIRTENLESETALHCAVRYERDQVVRLLVKEDPSHSHPQNKHMETPLYLASIRCYPRIIKTILDNCESPTFGGPDGRTALHAAVLDYGGHECVKLLLENNKDLIKEVDDYGWTAFHYVACNDLYTIVEDLVGADKSVGYLADKKYKRTALHLAAYKGNIRVMKKLVAYYPDTWDILDGNDQNIMHIAVDQRKREVIEFIWSRGFGAYNPLVIQRDREGNTPLHLMAKLKFIFSIQKAVKFDPEEQEKINWEEKIDWEVLDDKNLTPLDVLHPRKAEGYSTFGNQFLIRTLIATKARNHGHIWPTLKEPDVEKGSIILQGIDIWEKGLLEEYKSLINTQIVVAALIATVAMTAGFTMPGGFDQNHGSAILLRKTAFKAFIITDTIALLSSISSLLLYFLTIMDKAVRRVIVLNSAAVKFNIVSMVAMMLAFITGTYAVLGHSSALAISVCLISFIFFPLVMFFLFFQYMI